MKIIDSDGSGVIEFDEFVDWWVNKVSAAIVVYKYCAGHVKCNVELQ